MNIVISTTTGLLLYNFPSLFKYTTSIFFQSRQTVEKISVKERLENLDLDVKMEILNELKLKENKYTQMLEKSIERIMFLKKDIYTIIERNKKSWFTSTYANIEYKLYLLEKELKILEERFIYVKMLEN